MIGGDDGSCNLSSVEFYNPASDRWSFIPTNMSNGRSYAGEAAVSCHTPQNVSPPVANLLFNVVTVAGVAVIDKPL